MLGHLVLIEHGADVEADLGRAALSVESLKSAFSIAVAFGYPEASLARHFRFWDVTARTKNVFYLLGSARSTPSRSRAG
jgi:hypothetical protein